METDAECEISDVILISQAISSLKEEMLLKSSLSKETGCSPNGY
jgi:hypothetical protein